MATLRVKCETCGADIEVPDNVENLFCMHCGSQVKGKCSINSLKDSVLKETRSQVDNLIERFGVIKTSINNSAPNNSTPEVASNSFPGESIPNILPQASTGKVSSGVPVQNVQLKSSHGNLKVLGFVGLAVLVIVVILMGIFLSRNSSSTSGSSLQVPESSSEIPGKKYTDVVTLFEKAGFAKVETEKVKDLVIGWLKKEGDVEEVSINGDTTFTKGDEFPADASVVVRYHAFPDTKPEKTEAPKSSASPILEETSSPKNTDNTEDDKNIATETPKETPSQERLTVENSPELKALLSLKNPGDPTVAAFAKRYEGRNIEFDANICYMAPSEGYKHYFDFLICPGNYNPDTQSGPNFKIKRANATHDLHITGNAPEYVKKGDNIRLVAEVLEFNPNSELFFIKPVQTTYR